MKRFYIFLILGMLLMGTQTAQSMTIDYSNAFTLRDWDNNGNVDYIDDTNDGSGFWGNITRHNLWTDEHFLEFNISGLPLASQTYLNIRPPDLMEFVMIPIRKPAANLYPEILFLLN